MTRGGKSPEMAKDHRANGGLSKKLEPVSRWSQIFKPTPLFQGGEVVLCYLP